MTDRNTLSLAAKAAGIHWGMWDYERLRNMGHMVTPDMMWNPAEDDGETLRLATKLHLSYRINHFKLLNVSHSVVEVSQWHSGRGYVALLDERFKPGETDIQAIRRAVFKAAALIGEKL